MEDENNTELVVQTDFLDVFKIPAAREEIRGKDSNRNDTGGILGDRSTENGDEECIPGRDEDWGHGRLVNEDYDDESTVETFTESSNQMRLVFEGL